MKFENKGKWLQESFGSNMNDEVNAEEKLDEMTEEDMDELFEEDIDEIEDEDEEQINEVRYIDPDNLDRYNQDEIEEVITKSGEKRYKRKGGQSTSTATTANEPVEKEEPKKKKPEELKPGKTYTVHNPIMISDDISIFDEKEQEIIKKNGWLNKNGEVVLPKGTDITYVERGKYNDAFQTNDGSISFDTAISDDFSDFREKEEPKE